jgi:type IV pilus assembly protein PilA
MLSTIRKRKEQEGFTIIEVLIVLAIAGLILLIVFLAVPALQRNARNTQRKSDISGLLAGVSEFTNDNNGTAPTGSSYASGIVTYTGPSGTSNVTTSKIGYYKVAPTVLTTTVAGGSDALPASAPGVDAADIIVGAACKNNAPSTAASDGATARSVVAYYSVEQGGGSVAQCQGA